MTAYLIAVYDIGFSHLKAFSPYIRFVEDQAFVKIFLQLISDSEDECYKCCHSRNKH